MLDIKLIRETPDIVRDDLKKRGDHERLQLLEQLIEDDRRWRQLKAEVDELRRMRNVLTDEVARLKKAGLDTSEKLAEAQMIPASIEAKEVEMQRFRERVDSALLRLPNILHPSVPVGRDENDNVLVRSWGAPPKFDFPVKDHIDLMLNLDFVDIERAAKVAGARFFYLKGDAVRLEHAILRFAVDFLIRKSFELIEPPFMMRRKAYEGVTDLSEFGPVIYKVENEDLHLIATSEHPLIAMHMDEILDGKTLPRKYVGISPNFRVEAGAHGRDTKGIFRTHQFYKVEQIIICRPEESWTLHEELIGNAEAVFRAFGIHHRITNICTGDIGTVAAKKYDLDAWLPSQDKFREMCSCSNVTDYQARRLNIRFRDRPNEETRLVHTLNSTAVTTRALVAVVENYQQKDGSIRVPDALVPYMDGQSVIK